MIAPEILSGVMDKILAAPAGLVYLLVGALVFVEDALFIGFLVPGETAAILGGVAASLGHVSLAVVLAVVIVAAIVGDSAGYEVGRHFGSRVLATGIFAKRRTQLAGAQDFLRRRGGFAVFLGRWTAFFRAVMPALAGSVEMPYRKFLAYNALGGVGWSVAVVLLGYIAGRSYSHLEAVFGRGIAIVVAALVVIGLVVWRVRRHRAES
jgi:membrane-associated protein